MALTEEQARRVFNEAVAMRNATPGLRDSIQKVGDQPCRKLRVSDTNAEGRPLSRDKENMEGLNISAGSVMRSISGRDVARLASCAME